MTSRPRRAPAASASTRARKKLTPEQLDALIDEGVQLTIQEAIGVLRAEGEGAPPAYVKQKAMALFSAHIAGRLPPRADEGSVVQQRFMALMAEIRDVPGVQTLVTEHAIIDVPDDELIVNVNEEPDFDAEAEATSP